MICSAVESISAGGSISDGETLVSSDGSVELGFFDSGTLRCYLGIWYKKISTRTVVWVANGDVYLNDTSGVLQLTNRGILVSSGGTEADIPICSSSQDPTENPLALSLGHVKSCCLHSQQHSVAELRLYGRHSPAGDEVREESSNGSL